MGLVATVVLLGGLFIGILIYQPFYTNQMNQIRAGFMLMATCSAAVSLIMALVNTSESDGQWAGFTVLIIILFPSFIGGYVACDMAFKRTCNRKYSFHNLILIFFLSNCFSEESTFVSLFRKTSFIQVFTNDFAIIKLKDPRFPNLHLSLLPAKPEASLICWLQSSMDLTTTTMFFQGTKLANRLLGSF